jgi:hypothetical protein
LANEQIAGKAGRQFFFLLRSFDTAGQANQRQPAERREENVTNRFRGGSLPIFPIVFNLLPA